jgi:hypothetical protein
VAYRALTSAVLKSIDGIDFKLTLLPLGVLADMHTKPKYANLFDLAFFSSRFVELP